MICQQCSNAADQQAPASEHCNTKPGPGAPCDCAHRTSGFDSVIRGE